MNARLTVYLVILLALLNVGGLISLVLDLGRGHLGSALGKLLVLVLLDVFGIGLLRQVRDSG